MQRVLIKTYLLFPYQLKIDDFYFKCSFGENGKSKKKEKVIKKHQ